MPTDPYLFALGSLEKNGPSMRSQATSTAKEGNRRSRSGKFLTSEHWYQGGIVFRRPVSPNRRDGHMPFRGCFISYTMKARVLFLGLLFSSCACAQTAPLDRAEILGRLAQGYSPSYLGKLVKTRGVSFSASADFLERVQSAGGEGILVEGLRNAVPAAAGSSPSRPDRAYDFLAKCAERIHIGAASLAENDCRAALEENPESPWPILVALRVLALNNASTEERIALLRRAVTLDGTLVDAHRALAMADISPDQRAAEIEAVQSLERVHPADDSGSDAFVGQFSLNPASAGDENLAPESRQAVLTRLESGLAEKPELASVRLSAAWTYATLNDPENAASEIREAIRLEPGNADLRVALARFYGKQQDVNPAVAAYREAVRIAPYDCVYRRLLVEALLRDNRHEEAIREWKDFMLLSPRDPAASAALVNLYLVRGHRDSAIAELRRSLKASADVSASEKEFVEDRYRDIDLLARLLVENREFDSATQEYNYLLRFRPDDAVLHIRAGDVFFARQLRDPASREYREAVRLQPALADAHHRLANCLLLARNPDEAITEYSQSLALDPDKQESRIMLGAAFSAKGELNAAIEQFERVLAADPDNAVALANLGHSFYLNQNYPAASAALKRALLLKADFPAAKDELAEVVARSSVGAEAGSPGGVDAFTEGMLLSEFSSTGPTATEQDSALESDTAERSAPNFPASNH